MYPLDEITQGARYYMRIYPNMPRRYALHIAVGSMRDVERQAVRMGIDLRPTATEKVAVQASGKPW